jgi:hypothetical protein
VCRALPRHFSQPCPTPCPTHARGAVVTPDTAAEQAVYASVRGGLSQPVGHMSHLNPSVLLRKQSQATPKLAPIFCRDLLCSA